MLISAAARDRGVPVIMLKDGLSERVRMEQSQVHELGHSHPWAPKQMK